VGEWKGKKNSSSICAQNNKGEVNHLARPHLSVCLSVCNSIVEKEGVLFE